MNIVILGATGPTGRVLVDQALNQGHRVTALVRDKTKLPLRNEQLLVQQINILDEVALSSALSGHDAVLSALGPGRNLHSDIMSKSVPVLIRAMDRAKLRRLIIISSFGVGETKKQASFFSKLIFRLLLKDVLNDKFKSDQLLRASDLDYTLVYPTSLTNGKKTDQYKVGTQVKISFLPRISRADLAGFMLRELKENNFLRQTAIITN